MQNDEQTTFSSSKTFNYVGKGLLTLPHNEIVQRDWKRLAHSGTEINGKSRKSVNLIVSFHIHSKDSYIPKEWDYVAFKLLCTCINILLTDKFQHLEQSTQTNLKLAVDNNALNFSYGRRLD